MSKSSAQLKLARGIEHVNALCRDARSFENGDAYVPDVQRKLRSPKEIEYIVRAVERDRPRDYWALVAGEAIQNLRSALDHAVYAATKKDRGKTQFPIFTDACEFQVKGKPPIRAVPKPIRTLIEAAQPYNSLPTKPALDSLAILNSLSNRDKHRTLTTVASFVRFPFVGLAEGVEIRSFRQPHPGDRLSDGAVIARFVATSEAELSEMDVDPRFLYEIRIEGRPLVNTFTAIAKRAFEVVTECETGQPISPGAVYPIL